MRSLRARPRALRRWRQTMVQSQRRVRCPLKLWQKGQPTAVTLSQSSPSKLHQQRRARPSLKLSSPQLTNLMTARC